MITYCVNNCCDDNINISKHMFERPIKEFIYDNENESNVEIYSVKVQNMKQLCGVIIESKILSDSNSGNSLINTDSLNSKRLRSIDGILLKQMNLYRN